MSGPEFFETKMGRQFYDSTMPRIATALEDLVTLLDKRRASVDLAEELLADDPGKLEDETDQEWHNRLHDWCGRATELAKGVRR